MHPLPLARLSLEGRGGFGVRVGQAKRPAGVLQRDLARRLLQMLRLLLHRAAELANALADGAAEVGDFAGAEDEDHNRENDGQLEWPKCEWHVKGSPNV